MMSGYPPTPEVLGFYAALRVDVPDRPGNALTRCFLPDHDDRRPSATVQTDSGKWYCHACGEGGGPYEAALARGWDRRDAAELCKRYGLWRDGDQPDRAPSNGGRVSARKGADRPAIDKADTPPDPLPSEEQLGAWHERLLGSDKALERLRDLRGWTRPTIERFGLGYDGERIVFPVRDGDGRLLTVERYKPGDRAPGERKMLAPGGRPRQLFPAPESIKGDQLWLLEGAPDVLAAHEMGFGAVAIPGVGFARSVAAWAPSFAGRRVVVCFDCDREGRRAAETVARALAEHAAEVRVVDLDPGRDDGYDLTELLLEARSAANGDGPRQARVLLDRMAESAEPVTAPALPNGDSGDGSAAEFDSSPKESGRDERKERLPFAELTTVLANVPPEPDWLWDGYLAPGALTLFAGKPKVGKSTLIFGLMAALVLGEPFLQRPTRRAGVLLLSEEREGTLAEKQRRFGLGDGVHLLMWHQRRGVDWSVVVDDAVAYCKRHRLSVIVVDTWDKWTGLKGDDEKNAGPTLAALEPLMAAAGDGLCVVIVPHQRKAAGQHGEAVRGSNALTGGVDVVVELERPPSDVEGGSSRVVRAVSRYGSTPEELALRLSDDRYDAVGDVGTLRAESETARLLDALPTLEAATADALAEATGIPKATVHKRMTELTDAGRVTRKGEGKKGQPYSWEILSSRPISLGDESKQAARDAGAEPTAQEQAEIDRLMARFGEAA